MFHVFSQIFLISVNFTAISIDIDISVHISVIAILMLTYKIPNLYAFYLMSYDCENKNISQTQKKNQKEPIQFK